MSLLSWNSVKFIQRPSSRLINGLILATGGSLLLILTAGLLIPVNRTVTTTGSVNSELGDIEVSATTAGVLLQTVSENADVKEGQIIASIQPRAFSKVQLEYVTALLNFKSSKNIEERLLNIEKLFQEYPLEKVKMADSEVSLALLRVFSGYGGYQQMKLKNDEAIQSETRDLKLVNSELQSKINALKKVGKKKEFSFFIEGLQSEMRKNDLQINQIENSYQARTLAARQAVEDEARRAAIEINSYILTREIKSPVNGNLVKWYKDNRTMVSGGTMLAQIIPENSKIIAKVDVEARDLAKIEKGQNVLFRLEAFPYEKYGTGEGEVLTVKNVKSGKASYEVKATLRAPANVETKIPVGSVFRADIIVKKTNLSFFILNKIFGDRF